MDLLSAVSNDSDPLSSYRGRIACGNRSDVEAQQHHRRDVSQHDQSRQEFRNRLECEISEIFEKLFLELEHLLAEPIQQLEKRNSHIQPIIQRGGELAQSLKDMTPV